MGLFIPSRRGIFIVSGTQLKPNIESPNGFGRLCPRSRSQQGSA